jgi:hypothetical protein
MDNSRHILDKRSVRLEDVMKEGYIPFLGGRPEREKVISADDVLNMAISLNTTTTVEDFLSALK